MKHFTLIVLALSATACLPEGGIERAQQTTPDAQQQSDAPPADTAAAGPPCKDKVVDPAQIPDGHHFSGQNCMSSCHDHGFTLGGTLVDQNKAVYPGGIVTVVDAVGKTVDMTAGNNGNFYTAEPLVFPLTTYASACPDVAPMISSVLEGQGGCAMGGCHTGLANGISEVYLNR